MKGKSKAKSGYFRVKDGRHRGSAHAGWERRAGETKYTRKQAQESICKAGTCILKDHADHTQPPSTIMQLRPRGTCNQTESTCIPDNEKNTYRLFHMGKLCEMFNSAYHQHHLESPNCPANLQFDYQAEQQKGVCWVESLKCGYCKYHGPSTKIYEEVDTGKRGPKPAKPNLSVWVALLDNPIMGTGLQEIFHALNCPAPSSNCLQQNANKVGPMIVNMVQEDLRRERAHLKDLIENCGFPRETPIPAEGDGRYNNPLYWSRDRNPFQPATQATYTISENITNEKKIIGCVTRNKLCKRKLQEAQCPEHPGQCTANLKQQDPIGKEDMATEEICREFLSDQEPTLISHFTTDGDSAAFKGVERAMAKSGQVVESLRDTRHLAQSQKKAVDNAKFSEGMFPGRTAAQRQAIKRKFSVDFMKRCTAEYDVAVKKFRGDTEKLVNSLSYAADAIVQCYSGRCGKTCEEHSLVCGGKPEKHWAKDHLPTYARTLNLTEDDEDTLRQLINFRFSRTTLTGTRYGTNTQKSEGLHRGYSKSNPKNVTCSRNFEPQIFSSIHRMNHGPGKSTTLKCAALGSSIPEGTRLTRQLQRKQTLYENSKQRKKSKAYRTRRQVLIKEKFDLYFQKETDTQTGYMKGMSDPPLPQCSRRKLSNQEHSYSKPKK